MYLAILKMHSKFLYSKFNLRKQISLHPLLLSQPCNSYKEQWYTKDSMFCVPQIYRVSSSMHWLGGIGPKDLLWELDVLRYSTAKIQIVRETWVLKDENIPFASCE
jgi:hypothetical protein